VEQVHLGHWPLALAGSGTSLQPEVLVPASPLAPGLRSLLVSQGLALATTSGSGAHDPAAWLRRLASCRLAAPVPELLLDRQQGDFGQLERLAARTPLREHLWLLLPGYWRSIPVLQATVAALLQLAVEADQPGFDLCGALAVVGVDGTRVTQLCTGVLRQRGEHCRRRQGLRLEFQPLAATLAPGERLRLSLAGAAWPQIAVNPGDGQLPRTAPGPGHRVITLQLHLAGAWLGLDPLLAHGARPMGAGPRGAGAH
jgi:hypothetical protein